MQRAVPSVPVTHVHTSFNVGLPHTSAVFPWQKPTKDEATTRAAALRISYPRACPFQTAKGKPPSLSHTKHTTTTIKNKQKLDSDTTGLSQFRQIKRKDEEAVA